ncbi:hypothetical protein [Porphyromonas gulae]
MSRHFSRILVRDSDNFRLVFSSIDRMALHLDVVFLYLPYLLLP